MTHSPNEELHIISGSIFASSKHKIHSANTEDLCRWVKMTDEGYDFCDYKEREGKFIGFMTIDGEKCVVIDGTYRAEVEF